MKLEEQVLTLEQAKHLQELGLDMSDAALGWFPSQIGITDDGLPMYSERDFTIYERNLDDSYNIPTYTLQEVLDKLPIAFRPKPDDRNMLLYDSIADCQIWYENYYGNKMIYKDADTLLDAAYQLLCWVLENGYLKEEKK